MPRVSVLMPCYNAATTLEEALQSLASQSLQDYELVAVDDGSTDDTLAILEHWNRQDDRIKVFARTHQGIIEALNFGLGVCKAPYIARMDADDRSLPQRLSLQASLLDHQPQVGLVSCRVVGFPANQVRGGFQVYLDWLNNLLTDEEIRREIFVESPVPHPSVMFRKETVSRAGGYQEFGWPEDYDLWLRLYLAGVHFAKLPQVLLEWREQPSRLTRVDSRYSLENFLRAKAHYLALGPLEGSDGVILWGAGMVGRRMAKHLARHNIPLKGFVDVDPKKIGRTKRGLPVRAPEALAGWMGEFHHPVLLACVGARGARQLIRTRLQHMHLVEGLDWWAAA